MGAKTKHKYIVTRIENVTFLDSRNVPVEGKRVTFEIDGLSGAYAVNTRARNKDEADNDIQNEISLIKDVMGLGGV